MNLFTKRLKLLREEHDITQDELAKMLNVTRPAYANYETGAREPDFQILINIANHFNVSTDYLLGQTNYRYKISSNQLPNELFEINNYVNNTHNPKEILSLIKNLTLLIVKFLNKTKNK